MLVTTGKFGVTGMRKLAMAAFLTLLALFGASSAVASDDWALSFDAVDPAGHPMYVKLLILDASTDPYVGYFIASKLRSEKYTTLPDTASNKFIITLVSDVGLSSLGGTIRIRATDRYIGYYDGFTEFDLNYKLSSPQPVGATFIDSGVSGNGRFRYSLNFPYGDIGGGETFALSSLSAEVPEPTTWALLIGGLGTVGAALRRRAVVSP